AALSPAGVIQLDAPRPRWSLYALNRVSDGFLSGATLHLSTRAAGYDSDAAVWRALRTQPHLAVIDSAAVLSAPGYPAAPPPPTLYYFKAAPGVDPHVAARRVEAAYLPHGMEAIVMAEELDDGLGPKQALSYVLEGFMSLTLLMGVVALGLIAGRAVVERRHSVGTMRALGYSRRMVGLAFLAEALFTAVLGLALGGALGLILSKNLFDANFLQQSLTAAQSTLGTFVPYSPLLTFAIPWPVL